MPNLILQQKINLVLLYFLTAQTNVIIYKCAGGRLTAMKCIWRPGTCHVYFPRHRQSATIYNLRVSGWLVYWP